MFVLHSDSAKRPGGRRLRVGTVVGPLGRGRKEERKRSWAWLAFTHTHRKEKMESGPVSEKLLLEAS